MIMTPDTIERASIPSFPGNCASPTSMFPTDDTIIVVGVKSMEPTHDQMMNRYPLSYFA